MDARGPFDFFDVCRVSVSLQRIFFLKERRRKEFPPGIPLEEIWDKIKLQKKRKQGLSRKIFEKFFRRISAEKIRIFSHLRKDMLSLLRAILFPWRRESGRQHLLPPGFFRSASLHRLQIPVVKVRQKNGGKFDSFHPRRYITG